jgi:hypothetical protein
VLYITREAGFISGVIIDMLWKSVLLKLDQLVGLMGAQVQKEKDRQSSEFLRNLEHLQTLHKQFESDKLQIASKYENQIKEMT